LHPTCSYIFRARKLREKFAKRGGITMADKPKKDAKPVAEDCGCGCVTKKK